MHFLVILAGPYLYSVDLSNNHFYLICLAETIFLGATVNNNTVHARIFKQSEWLQLKWCSNKAMW